MSTYFEPDSHENINDIIADYPGSPSRGAVYMHLKNHKFAMHNPAQFLKTAEKRLENEGKGEVLQLIGSALNSETVEVLSQKPNHIEVLDAIISEGREQILNRKIKLKPSDVLTAVKIKADIEKGQKDRTKDLIQTLAGLAAPKGQA